MRVELRRKDSNLRDLFQRQAACHWLTPQEKSAREDLNFRPLGYQPSARPSELRAVKKCDRPGRIRTDDPPLKRRMPWAAWLPACRVKTVAEGFEPTVTALTERCLTSLATPHRQEVAGTGIEPAFGGRLMRPPCPQGTSPHMTAAAGLEPAHSCLLDKRSVSSLSYAARMDREGLEPSQEVCGTSMQPLHHQPL